MQSLKQTSIDILKALPDTTSLEEIMYRLNMTAQAMEGLQDAKEGKTISTDELLKKIDSWQQK